MLLLLLMLLLFLLLFLMLLLWPCLLLLIVFFYYQARKADNFDVDGVVFVAVIVVNVDVVALLVIGHIVFSCGK